MKSYKSKGRRGSLKGVHLPAKGYYRGYQSSSWCKAIGPNGSVSYDDNRQDEPMHGKRWKAKARKKKIIRKNWYKKFGGL